MAEQYALGIWQVKGERQDIINQLTQLDEDEKALNAHKLIEENDDKILSYPRKTQF